MNNGVDFFEASRIGQAGVRVPLNRIAPAATRASADANDLVTAFIQLTDRRSADEAGGTADSNGLRIL